MNIFEDKTTECPPDNWSVRTMMVPGENHDRTMQLIEQRKFENADVQNVTRPRFGHGY